MGFQIDDIKNTIAEILLTTHYSGKTCTCDAVRKKGCHVVGFEFKITLNCIILYKK